MSVLALALGCADDQAPLLSDIENTDFFYSITDSTVKARNARYGSGKSVKVFQGQVRVHLDEVQVYSS